MDKRLMDIFASTLNWNKNESARSSNKLKSLSKIIKKLCYMNR